VDVIPIEGQVVDRVLDEEVYGEWETEEEVGSGERHESEVLVGVETAL